MLSTLIEHFHTTHGQTRPPPSTPSLATVAAETSNVHNLLQRELNNNYSKAPFILLPADLADFLLYITASADTVHHHHSLEETLLFPAWKLWPRLTTDELMDGNHDLQCRVTS
jgi:hypothetical protein